METGFLYSSDIYTYSHLTTIFTISLSEGKKGIQKTVILLALCNKIFYLVYYQILVLSEDLQNLIPLMKAPSSAMICSFFNSLSFIMYQNSILISSDPLSTHSLRSLVSLPSRVVPHRVI